MKIDSKTGFNLKYLCAFLIVLAIEVTIALCAVNNFIRVYLGDVLVVVLIYTFIKIFVRSRMKLLPLYIFLFAVLVEIGQYFHLVDWLGLGDSVLARTVLGTTFDAKDIVCYLVGCVGIQFFEAYSEKPVYRQKTDVKQ